jgi:hypothetical protein
MSDSPKRIERVERAIAQLMRDLHPAAQRDATGVDFGDAGQARARLARTMPDALALLDAYSQPPEPVAPERLHDQGGRPPSVHNQRGWIDPLRPTPEPAAFDAHAETAEARAAAYGGRWPDGTRTPDRGRRRRRGATR